MGHLLAFAGCKRSLRGVIPLPGLSRLQYHWAQYDIGTNQIGDRPAHGQRRILLGVVQ